MNTSTRTDTFVSRCFTMVELLGWSAAMNVTSVCYSIMSMLASATKRLMPVNDKDFVSRAVGKSPKDFKWVFHDDKC